MVETHHAAVGAGELALRRRAATPPVSPPLGRLVEPDEVAGLTRFLLEPSGAMVTGQTIVICGGASLG
ncbi:MAG: SDR family oxidoreductase [Terracoccus sp.]